MMQGVVLCGGQSSRMGSDKGLLPAGNKIWAERAVSKLMLLDIPVVLSINASQFEAYSQVFSENQLIVDSVHAKGPLTGLLSTHEALPQQDILLFACDMLDVDHQTLQYLKDIYEAEIGLYDYYAYELNGFIEPLCTVYPSMTIKLLREKFLSGELPYFSLQRIISGSNYRRIPISDNRKFANYNSTNPFS